MHLEFVRMSTDENVDIQAPLQQRHGLHVSPGNHLVAMAQPDPKVSNLQYLDGHECLRDICNHGRAWHTLKSGGSQSTAPLRLGAGSRQSRPGLCASRSRLFSGSHKSPAALLELGLQISWAACHIRHLRHTFVQRLPGQRIWCTFPGTKSALNFKGKSTVLCGMCRSPMQSTKTMPLTLFLQPRAHSQRCLLNMILVIVLGFFYR